MIGFDRSLQIGVNILVGDHYLKYTGIKQVNPLGVFWGEVKRLKNILGK
jgi:hypothetical protein